MKLVPQKVKLKEIIVDPFNPRFITQGSIDQNILISNLLGKKYVKDLLRSMQVDIKWVNRIVIQKIDTHEFSQQLEGLGSYVVVEGNTRTVCLKSGKIPNINEESEIPVLVAELEREEHLEDFRKDIRITQGIANVTVVKEWDPISKARHLRKLYDGFKQSDSEAKPSKIYKLIADELGKTVNEIRQSIIRYTLYSKICEISDTIPEDKFGYIEAFDKNKETRQKFGMSPDTNEIYLEGEENEAKEELLEKIPDLIRVASIQGINTKQFRDILNKNFDQDLDAINNLFGDLIDDESSVTFHTLISGEEQIDLQEKWQNILETMFEHISAYPLMEDWASQNSEKLSQIKTKLDKIVSLINEN
jgi:hypothetical protein